MRFLTCLSVLLMAISLESCAPNSSVALDNGNSDVSTPGESPAALREPAIKITVAELMDRVVHASSDSFLFPCTLNAYSAADRAKLQKLRQTWLSKERDNRYLLSPSTDCVCPGICALAIEDTQNKGANNYGIIVFGEGPPESYLWLIRNLDLKDAQITWSDTAPQIIFRGPNKAIIKTCSIALDKNTGRYMTPCTDSQGKKVAPLGPD